MTNTWCCRCCRRRNVWSVSTVLHLSFASRAFKCLIIIKIFDQINRKHFEPFRLRAMSFHIDILKSVFFLFNFLATRQRYIWPSKRESVFWFGQTKDGKKIRFQVTTKIVILVEAKRKNIAIVVFLSRVLLNGLAKIKNIPNKFDRFQYFHASKFALNTKK